MNYRERILEEHIKNLYLRQGETASSIYERFDEDNVELKEFIEATITELKYEINLRRMLPKL